MKQLRELVSGHKFEPGTSWAKRSGNDDIATFGLCDVGINPVWHILDTSRDILFTFLCTEYIRPGGCKKGLFSRERQPKMAAHITRWRYWTLAHSSTNVTLPNDFLFAGP
jgi:hypothetical protein